MEDNAVNYLWGILIGYAFGCIQTSYVTGLILKKVDIRNYGSGNAGATNAYRVFGPWFGTFCLVIDILKGVGAVLISKFCLEDTTLLLLVTGLGVIFGHNYPFYMKFKGGKGIAASLGIFLAIDYRAFFLAGIPALILLATTRYMSVASLTYSALLIVFMAVFHYNDPNGIYIILLTAVFTALAFWRHRENLKRLKNGTENKLGKKKKKEEPESNDSDKRSE